MMETPFYPEDAPRAAAREILKHLDGAENFELPLIGENPGDGSLIELDYDDTVGLIEGIIRHYFSLEPNDETAHANTDAR